MTPHGPKCSESGAIGPDSAPEAGAPEIPERALLTSFRSLALCRSGDVSLWDYKQAAQELLLELRKIGWVVAPSSSKPQNPENTANLKYIRNTLLAL